MNRSSSPRTSRGISRRRALAMSAAAPFVATSAAAAPNQETVAKLVQRSELQALLFNTGEMHRWYELVDLGETFTLMQPFGGATSHGFDPSPERLNFLSENFRNGDARLELDQAYATDDMVVLVYIERQSGEVHGLPKQDWSLRVTQVFLRDGARWRLVHRHADPLVRQITLAHTADLAAGRAGAAAANS